MQRKSRGGQGGAGTKAGSARRSPPDAAGNGSSDRRKQGSIKPIRHGGCRPKSAPGRRSGLERTLLFGSCVGGKGALGLVQQGLLLGVAGSSVPPMSAGSSVQPLLSGGLRAAPPACSAGRACGAEGGRVGAAGQHCISSHACRSARLGVHKPAQQHQASTEMGPTSVAWEQAVCGRRGTTAAGTRFTLHCPLLTGHGGC